MATLYKAADALAAFFIASIVVFTTVLVVGRILEVRVPDLTDFCAFSMAAAGFLAMAGTFRSGGHIRVSLVIGRLNGKPRRFMEGFCLIFAIVLVGTIVWSSLALVRNSISFGDLSTGMIPVPLWIPQLGMVFGTALLEIAMIEDFIRLLRDEKLSYDKIPPIDQEI